MELWFLNGILVGLTLSLGGFLYLTGRRLNNKTQLINDNLSKVLEGVVESHNNLNQIIATIDKKATETSLRVDQLNGRKAPSVAKFPSHV